MSFVIANGLYRKVKPLSIFDLDLAKVLFYRKFGGEQRAERFKYLVRLAYWPRLAVAALGAPFSPSLAVQARASRRLLAGLPGM